jgi:glycosyltransferase involved in cell wall biosynthesis
MQRPTIHRKPSKAGSVFLFQRIYPPAYRTAVFEKLDAAIGGRLVICAGPPGRGAGLHALMPQQDAALPQVSLKNYNLLGGRLHAQTFREAFELFGCPSVVISDESPRSLSLPFLLRYARRQGAGTVLWGHFSSNNRAFTSANLLDRRRIRLARSADACLCYTEDIAKLLRPHVPEQRIFVARNTLDTDALFKIHHELSQQGKANIRERLRLDANASILVFLGRLTAAKGTNLLLDVYKQYRKLHPAHLLIIGDGPDRMRMEQRLERENIADVKFLGALPELEQSAPYIYASDVMLVPGYLGLAVNHAFAFGVPVVSQASPGRMRFHSPEVAYVTQRDNGILSEYGNRDAMLQALVDVLEDQDRYSRNALNFARQNLTIDRMIEGMVEAVGFAEQCRATARRQD